MANQDPPARGLLRTSRNATPLRSIDRLALPVGQKVPVPLRAQKRVVSAVSNAVRMAGFAIVQSSLPTSPGASGALRPGESGGTLCRTKRPTSGHATSRASFYRGLGRCGGRVGGVGRLRRRRGDPLRFPGSPRGSSWRCFSGYATVGATRATWSRSCSSSRGPRRPTRRVAHRRASGRARSGRPAGFGRSRSPVPAWPWGWWIARSLSWKPLPGWSIGSNPRSANGRSPSSTGRVPRAPARGGLSSTRAAARTPFAPPAFRTVSTGGDYPPRNLPFSGDVLSANFK